MASFITAVYGENVFLFLGECWGANIWALNACEPLSSCSVAERVKLFSAPNFQWCNWSRIIVMEFGPFGSSSPSLETGLALVLFGCFHVPRCALSPKHTKSIVLHTINVEHHWICENNVNYENTGAGNDRGAVWDGPGVVLSPSSLHVAHRPADMM